MSTAAPPAARDLERRKHVRLRLRSDLSITPQKYEGKTYYVLKDPVTLRYYRFKEQEHFLLGFMDGKHTLDEAQKEYEKRFRPERLTLEDLEHFAQQLLTAGLVQHESPGAGKLLLERRKKRKRSQLLQAFTNILYIKIPLFDPDKLLKRMVPYFSFVFSLWFFFLSVAVMFGAVTLVLMHFDTFRGKLPSYHEFFSFKTVIYLWIALGVVKVIHEFGHGLSCKKFGGEVHEMGLLFLVFSPCMYCNVSDSWTLPSKWKRIVISAAGIYVELLIAAIATFIWWNTPTKPFINHLSLCLMVVCSVSTVLFNANPLMRYDGYYVLADWIEIPNLRERSNRFLKNLFLEHCLGVEVQPEPYMALWRKCLFVFYAITAWLYRWIITFVILWFLYNFLKPYGLGVISAMLALAALGSMTIWPIVRLVQNIRKRGRLPDMKPVRVTLTCSIVVALILCVFLVPLPVSRVTATGLVQMEPGTWEPVYVTLAENDQAILRELHVADGQWVNERDVLAVFSNREVERELATARLQVNVFQTKLEALNKEWAATRKDEEKFEFEREIEKTKLDQELAIKQANDLQKRIDEEGTVRAPQSGVVMVPPKIDDVGKLWDKRVPLCKVGDPKRLRVLIPVEPSDYNLLQENLRKSDNVLAVTLRVPGMGNERFRGRVTNLPEAAAPTIPLALSSKADGPVPVKPSNNPDELIPQTQQYLVAVELIDPDPSMVPGMLSKAKVHCRKRPLSWWLWRSINDTFNLGLL